VVAIFTGLSAGFERGSAAALGANGLLGSSALGRGNEGVFLNAASGNLVLSRQDEFLVGRGPDVAIARAYNSFGALDPNSGAALDENGDYWRQSTDRRIFMLTGTANTAGSTVKRVSADGSVITYTHNGSHYATTDGAGAHDKLIYDPIVTGGWTWIDGDTQVVEKYEPIGAAYWYIKEQIDPDGNKLTFTYTGDKLSRVTTQDGGFVEYGWSGNNITIVATYYTDLVTSVSTALMRTRYTYDGSNRLSQVILDLTPGDVSIADGNVYTTTYTYDGASKRIASITQTDGSSLAITYDAQDRVEWMTQTVASGDTRKTQIIYASDNSWTDIKVYTQEYAGGSTPSVTTRLERNASGQLTKVIDATGRSTTYTYDAAGNVLTATDAAGTKTYSYDSNGNVASITDANNNVITRAYDTNNNLILQTVTGTSAAGPSRALHTRYVYDGENHLRYMISPEGRVTEHVYTAPGEISHTREYPQHLYATQLLPGSHAQDWPNTSTLTTFNADDFVRTVESIGGQEALVFRKGWTAMAYGGYTLGGQVAVVGGGPPNGFYSVTPGKTYSYAFDAYSELSGMALVGQIHFMDAAGAVIHQDAWAVENDISAWRHIAAGAVAPSGAVYARLAITIQRAGSDLADDHMMAFRNIAFVGAEIPTLSAMNAWRDGLGDRSWTAIKEYRYDARGGLVESVSFGRATTVGDPAVDEGYSHTFFTYDQAGQLRSRHTLPHASETFVYDGLGRLTASTDLCRRHDHDPVQRCGDNHNRHDGFRLRHAFHLQQGRRTHQPQRQRQRKRSGWYGAVFLRQARRRAPSHRRDRPQELLSLRQRRPPDRGNRPLRRDGRVPARCSRALGCNDTLWRRRQYDQSWPARQRDPRRH
jgi:YD repeat-containing protein